jgi:membrane protein YqaA with SNARE-associated domain
MSTERPSWLRQQVTTVHQWEHRLRRERRLRPVALMGVIAVIIAAAVLRDRLPILHTVSYPSIFILSLMGSASIVVPIPSIASVCAGTAFLNLSPIVVALVAAAGETLGELTGYTAGFGGRTVIERYPVYQRLVSWVRRRGGFMLFLFSAIPNPVFDVVGIAAGSLRYPLHLFLLIALSGKILKDLGIAYACYFGLESVLRVIFS